MTKVHVKREIPGPALLSFQLKVPDQTGSFTDAVVNIGKCMIYIVLSISSKLEGECLAQWSEHWQLKPGALGSIPGGCLDVFSSSKLSDVDGVMSPVVL